MGNISYGPLLLYQVYVYVHVCVHALIIKSKDNNSHIFVISSYYAESKLQIKIHNMFSTFSDAVFPQVIKDVYHGTVLFLSYISCI